MDFFLGYGRESGRPGVRNHLLILNITGLTEAAAKRIQATLPKAVLASTPFGTGMMGEDAKLTFKTLCGIALNPNCGAVLIIGADRMHVDQVLCTIQESGKPCDAVCLDEANYDSLALTITAIRKGAEMLKGLSRHRREKFGLEHLYVGMECGLSDPTSGLAANPLLGKISDNLVAQGATVVVGETLEWLGTEQQLSKRGATAAVAIEIVEAVSRREQLAIDAGVDLAGINPNTANIKSGLTTIEEKASGSIAKSGTAPIGSVLSYGDMPISHGLHLMDAPSATPESLTGFVASGAQLILFTTGLGNSYCSAVSPTVKISANQNSVCSLQEQIDFDASSIIDTSDVETSFKALSSELMSVASGALTFGEILGEGNEVISRIGASL